MRLGYICFSNQILHDAHASKQFLAKNHLATFIEKFSNEKNWLYSNTG
jgi:hypothetical protein